MADDDDCALCGDPIQADEAWMGNEVTGAVAHAGCVYRDERQPERQERWLPSAMTTVDRSAPKRVSPLTFD